MANISLVNYSNSKKGSLILRNRTRKTLAERIDVRTKMAMLAVLIATGAIVKDYVLGSVLFAVVVLLSFAIGRGKTAVSFSFAYLFLMGIFWATTMLPPNATGALGSFALACRTCMPICLFAAVFATTTKIGDLTAALYGMRLPKAVVVPLVIAVRFFPTLKEESSAVTDAMRVRGLALSPKNLVSKPALMFESAVVPVMLRCAKIADELAAAAVARGIDRPGRKTSYNAPRFGWADFLSFAFLVICCSLLVAAKVNQGIGGLL